MDQKTAYWDHCLQHAAISDVGLRRANNQDAVAVLLADSQQTWVRQGHLFVVADGMGAHAAGELASKLATDTVTLAYSKRTDMSPPEAILSAIQAANAKIHSRGQADEEFQGMGTTSTALLILPQGAVLAHVGDSRGYRLRGDRFEQLTFDHSLVWELRAAGQLSGEIAGEHVPKNIITRSLGPNPSVSVDLEGPFPIVVGDTFVLCSDGLSGPVADEEIGAILMSMAPEEAAQALVDLANLRGGPDNITVLVTRVTGPQLTKGGGGSGEFSAGPRVARPVHPLLWTLLGMFALTSAGAAAMEYWLAALVCLGGAIATGVLAMAVRYGNGGQGGRFRGRSLGKGPYSACKAAANSEFVARLERIVEELRQAATQEKWAVEWKRFNAYRVRAAEAKTAADYPRSIREYFHAISFMMGQLKHQRHQNDSDSQSVLGP